MSLKLRRNPWAFTLAEALLTMVLLAMIFSLTFVNFQNRKSSVQSRALAELLASRLAQARQLAMSGGVPVGLAFPIQGAASAQVQSSYLLQGDRQPRVLRVDNWRNELPEATCFTGAWTLDAGKTWAPPAPLEGSESFDLAAWVADRPGDALFVFTPSGALISNQPTFDGSYHLVTSLGLSTHDGTLLAAHCWWLDGVREPWTIVLARSGSTIVQQGVAGASALSSASTSPIAPALPMMGLTNHDPSLMVEVMPTPPVDSLPLNIDATVSPGGYVTFHARATDPDGDPLRCIWSCASGSFSADQETRMEWDPTQAAWISRWTFTPPPTAVVGQIYTLRCTVKDDRGGSVTGYFGAGGQLLITKKARLLFSSDVDTGNGIKRGLYISNIDGNERKLISDARDTVDSPRWSPDGSHILFLSDPGASFNLSLYTVNPDGTDCKVLVDRVAQGWMLISGAAFTPDGTKIILAGYNPGAFDLAWINVDGTKPSDPSTNGIDFIKPAIYGNISFSGLDVHPTTGQILVSLTNGTYQLYKTDGSNVTVNQAGPLTPGQTELYFSPDGNSIFSGENYVTCSNATFTYSGAGVQVGSPTLLCGSAAYPTQGPTVSPDGVYLFYHPTSAGVQHIVRREIATGEEHDLTPPGYLDDDACCSP